MQTLELELVEEDYSSYTLAPIIAKFMEEFLELEPLFEEHISLKKRYSRFSIGKLAFLSAFLVILGIERFSHLDDKWVRERGLAKINNVPRLPGKSTFFQFLSSFGGNQINQLARVHRILVRKHRNLWMPKRGPYPIDIDLNTKSVEGRKIEKAIKGYNKKRPGRNCLQWSRGLFCGVPFWSKLHAGNTNSVQSLKEELRWIRGEIESYMPHALSGAYIRLDGGYWSPKILQDIDLPWMIHCPMLKQFHTDQYIGNSDRAWKTYSRTTQYIDLGRQQIGNMNARVLLVEQLERPMRKTRGNTKPKYIYYTIATSLSHWSAASIIRAYRGRQVIEDHFKETNQSFFSNKLPSGGLRANEAFLWFVTFAYTISTFFKSSSLANLMSATKF